MKRLLCILSSMDAGGAETFLMKIYKNMDHSKFQMDFCINVKEKCFYEDEILNLGGKIFRVPSKSESLSGFKHGLYEIIKKNNYSYVLRVTSSAMGFMDLKIAKRAGAKKCCARSSNASDGDSIKSKICHKLGKILYMKYVDVMIAPSDLAAKYTFGENAYRDGRVHIIHNGVDLNVYKYLPEQREKIRKEFSISLETKLIGHIGRFVEQKNHMFLLEIFKKIHMIDTNTKLLLVGEGKLEELIRMKALKLGIHDDVIFAGLRTDIPGILSAMDIFVLPSFYEGMPNTVIEAQATGLPCVIADTITRDANITSFVHYLSLNNADAWAEHILTQITKRNSDIHQSFATHGYNINTVVREFIQIIFND